MKLYFEAGRQWAVEDLSQSSVSAITRRDGLTFVSTSNRIQNPLNKAGDHTRIDWGTFYLAASDKNSEPFMNDGRAARTGFLSGKK